MSMNEKAIIISCAFIVVDDEMRCCFSLNLSLIACKPNNYAKYAYIARR